MVEEIGIEDIIFGISSNQYRKVRCGVCGGKYCVEDREDIGSLKGTGVVEGPEGSGNCETEVDMKARE